MSARLIIAVPSKGRLQEKAIGFFAQIGTPIETAGGARDYVGRLGGLDGVEVLFLQAAEIADRLRDGTVHLGITGEDLLHEHEATPGEKVEILKPLGFGRADLVVAVPKTWIDVDTMADLDEVAAGYRARHGRRLRVATKYLKLTHGFFVRHAVSDYRIVESLGATEGAPASGTAEIVVDITSTGATLAANNLKILNDGVILRSQAVLGASLKAAWGEGALAALARILDLVAADETGRRERIVEAWPKAAPSPDLLAQLEGAGLSVIASGEGRLVGLARADALADIADVLRAGGADPVVVREAEAVFHTASPMLDRFRASLSR
ncbi:MAG: ATP phosphoribosyltransferase [Alphaproteobacteria bacterium]|nr:ATP phosphoribosyltransferase [Alphaproteobacteria bacterium]MDX5368683.1 ATP phosphoribosyltransferase [Alphaproteobacteria bacterium]